MKSMADHLAERAAFLKAFDDWCGPQAEALVRIGNAAFEVERIAKGIPMTYDTCNSILCILREIRKDSEAVRVWVNEQHDQRQEQARIDRLSTHELFPSE